MASSMTDEMTWDDGLSLDALGQYLRRHAPDAMPLLLFCIDCSRFLRHVSHATDGTCDLPILADAIFWLVQGLSKSGCRGNLNLRKNYKWREMH